MWICGAGGAENKETGILEEIQLENCYRNNAGVYSIWDSVLYEKIAFQPNLRMLLNCSCHGATVSNGAIESVDAWQLTSQTRFTVHARHFIDCSGDSILAPAAGADFRTGREAREEFDEDIQPFVGDDKTMGNSLLIQLRKTDEPQDFIPPRWAYKFTSPEDFPRRMHGINGHNFWWIELGGLNDTIHDAERIRDELMKAAYGVWDYIKNRAPEREKARNWALEWLGSLPGKRENRRFMGPHILTQNDIRSGGKFDDMVAYGGWSMDDHHPAGLLYPGAPTIFHPAPCPYGIPYRSLFSRNISNLFFAGRNISVTHAALSSTRVMATCCLLGQAVGTAAALCVELGCAPAALYPSLVPRLQQQLMHDDVWLPGLRRQVSDLTRTASVDGGEKAELVRDGIDRDFEKEPHSWQADQGTPLTFRWSAPVTVEGLRLVLDSDLRDVKRMPCSFPLKGNRCAVPKRLLKAFRVEALRHGTWETIHRTEENYQRLVYVKAQAECEGIRLIPEGSWGAESPRVLAMDVLERFTGNVPTAPEGPSWASRIAAADPEDLRPPDNGGEEERRVPGA